MRVSIGWSTGGRRKRRCGSPSADANMHPSASNDGPTNACTPSPQLAASASDAIAPGLVSGTTTQFNAAEAAAVNAGVLHLTKIVLHYAHNLKCRPAVHWTD